MYCGLQEDRFAPAPDVTRRLGSTTPLGKPEAGTPPYYRAASATNSSSSNSTSSSEYNIVIYVTKDLMDLCIVNRNGL